MDIFRLYSLHINSGLYLGDIARVQIGNCHKVFQNVPYAPRLIGRMHAGHLNIDKSNVMQMIIEEQNSYEVE